MNGKCFSRFGLTFLLLTCALAATAVAAEPDDARALKDISIAHGVFDVSRSRPDTLLGAMKLVAETRDGLLRQGVKPDFVVLFRGPAVTLLSTDRQGLDKDEQQLLGELDRQIRSLEEAGVAFNVCSIATRMFKVDNHRLLPGLEPVGNALISLIALQQKGYALVPLY